MKARGLCVLFLHSQDNSNSKSVVSSEVRANLGEGGKQTLILLLCKAQRVTVTPKKEEKKKKKKKKGTFD